MEKLKISSGHSPNVKKAIKFLVDNATKIDHVLYIDNNTVKPKYKIYGFYDIDFLTEKSARIIINHLQLVSLPGYKHYGNLGIGSTIYVMPQNVSRY